MQNKAIAIPADFQAEYGGLAETLLTIQKFHGEKVREQSMAAYRRLNVVHLLITGVLAAGLLRANGKITPLTETGEERNALFASYVIGMDICERAIEEGRYLQSLALLRQEMETLAQLKLVAAGKRKEGRSPNISCLPKSIARLYDDLSAAAHVSKHSVVRTATEWEVPHDHLPGPTAVTRHFPAFAEDLARRCFALHLMLTLRVIEELSVDMSAQPTDDGFNERDSQAIDLAVELMAAEGVLEQKEDL